MQAVVTGIGVVSPFGIGRARFAAGLAAGDSAGGPIRSFAADSFSTKVAAEVRGFAEEHSDVCAAAKLLGATPAQLAALSDFSGYWRDRKVAFAALAAIEACQHAKISAGLRAAELSLAVGLERAFLADLAQCQRDGGVAWPASDEPTPIKYRTAVDVSTNVVAGVTGVAGLAVTHASACAAGALAVAHAAALVARGTAQVVLCGGADSMINPMGLGGMSRLGATSPRASVDACRPFDKRRDGLLIGEGAAMFVVESAAHAKARGASPLAIISGWGSSQDAYKVTAPRPDGSAAAVAMQQALRRAGLRPIDIDYINAHGTGTPLNDPTEIKAIRTAFGEAAASIPISSIKGAIGHLMAASGAIEIAASLLALSDGYIPGTAHLEEIDPACALDIVGPKPRAMSLRRVMSNSFGFGGQNAVVIVEAP